MQSHSQRQDPRPPTHACTPRPPTFLPHVICSFLSSGLTSPCSPTKLKAPHFPHETLHTHFPAASCVGRYSLRGLVPAFLPTTLGSFCLRRGIRGSFMLMRLKRPHSRCGAFFRPSESSLWGRGLSKGAGLVRGLERKVRCPRKQKHRDREARARVGRATSQGREPWIEPNCVGSHRRAGSLPRQAQQQPSSESSRPRSRASSAPAPITPLRWLVSVGGIGSAPVLAQPHTPQRDPSLLPPSLTLTQATSTGDRIARVFMAAAGLCAVHAVEPWRARQVTTAVEHRVREDASSPP